MKKLLILDFIYNLIYKDYRGYIKEKDYRIFESALECLYGTSCLIPYMDYLKMGKLKLGEMTEVFERTEKSEKAVRDMAHEMMHHHEKLIEIRKALHEQDTRVHEIEDTKVVKGKTFIGEIPDIEL